MKFHNFIVFDVETGGLDKKNNLHAIMCPITEIALVGYQFDTLNEIDRYSSYIKGRYANNKYIGYSILHDQEYQDGAIKATGITREILEEKGQDYKKVCNDIIELFEKTHSGSRYHNTMLVGHNVNYDIPFLQYLFKICKKDLSKYIQGYYNHEAQFTPAFFDTMYLSRFKSLDESQKHNLLDTSMREGVELIDAHAALNDVLATAEVFKKYIRLLRNGKEGSVMQESESNSFRKSFAFEY